MCVGSDGGGQCTHVDSEGEEGYVTNTRTRDRKGPHPRTELEDGEGIAQVPNLEVGSLYTVQSLQGKGHHTGARLEDWASCGSGVEPKGETFHSYRAEGG